VSQAAVVFALIMWGGDFGSVTVSNISDGWACESLFNSIYREKHDGEWRVMAREHRCVGYQSDLSRGH
jgi:hypothetical protein